MDYLLQINKPISLLVLRELAYDKEMFEMSYSLNTQWNYDGLFHDHLLAFRFDFEVECRSSVTSNVLALEHFIRLWKIWAELPGALPRRLSFPTFDDNMHWSLKYTKNLGWIEFRIPGLPRKVVREFSEWLRVNVGVNLNPGEPFRAVVEKFSSTLRELPFLSAVRRSRF